MAPILTPVERDALAAVPRLHQKCKDALIDPCKTIIENEVPITFTMTGSRSEWIQAAEKFFCEEYPGEFFCTSSSPISSTTTTTVPQPIPTQPVQQLNPPNPPIQPQLPPQMIFQLPTTTQPTFLTQNFSFIIFFTLIALLIGCFLLSILSFFDQQKRAAREEEKVKKMRRMMLKVQKSRSKSKSSSMSSIVKKKKRRGSSEMSG